MDFWDGSQFVIVIFFKKKLTKNKPWSDIFLANNGRDIVKIFDFGNAFISIILIPKNNGVFFFGMTFLPHGNKS